MKKLVIKNLGTSPDVFRWIGNCGPSIRLYWPALYTGLPINKRIAAPVLLLVICVFQVTADDFGLDEKIGMVLQILSSPWSRVSIACIVLIVECINHCGKAGAGDVWPRMGP
jgi:hypothetical protein